MRWVDMHRIAQWIFSEHRQVHTKYNGVRTYLVSEAVTVLSLPFTHTHTHTHTHILTHTHYTTFTHSHTLHYTTLLTLHTRIHTTYILSLIHI